MRKLLMFTLFVFIGLSGYSQDWSSWTAILDGNKNGVEYSYKMTPCKYDDGENFGFKLRSKYDAKACGKIKVVIEMSSGLVKTLEYEFKNLDFTERRCYGIEQICGTKKLISVAKISFFKCDTKQGLNTGVNEIEFKKPKKN